MNRWGIPAWLEEEVRERDKTCVYCGVQMVEKPPHGGSRRNVATWEHIINDATIVTRENITGVVLRAIRAKVPRIQFIGYIRIIEKLMESQPTRLPKS